MHKFLEKIKKLETRPRVINNFLNTEEVKLFKKLYEELHLDHENSIKLNENYWAVSQEIRLPRSFEKEIEELFELSMSYKHDLARDLLFKLLKDLRIVDHPAREGISA